MEIDVNFDIENVIFLRYKEFITENSKYSPKVFSKAPKQLTYFPTITFREQSNVDNTKYRTLDRSQKVNRISDVIEIYTKDMIIEGERVASKTVMSELKYLTFEFFDIYGFERLSCDIAESNDYQVDRLVIIERCNQNNWNKKISQ